MKKLGIVVTALAVLALPSGALAKSSKAEKRHAAKECRAYKDAAGADNFRSQYGNFGGCVKATVRENRAERKQARRQARAECEGLKGRERRSCARSEKKALKAQFDAEDNSELNAAAACRSLQEEMGEENFRQEYGTNGREGTPGYKRNAFGKCVSAIAQEQGDDEEIEEEGLEEEELEEEEFEEEELEEEDPDEV